MQKIVPHLWFDTEAKEAANFYVSVFGGDSKVGTISTLTGTPSGDTDVVPFSLWGYNFLSISAGPYFKPTPAISFMVNFDPSQDKDAATKIDEVWKKLAEGGKVMMPIGEYPFSKRYGWVADKYGFSWQLILTDPKGEERPLIIPSFLFVREKARKAEAAMKFWAGVFRGAPLQDGETKVGDMMHYPTGTPDEGTVMFGEVKLAGQWFSGMDSADKAHEFDFNEAISIIINCEDQAELDYFWEKLSAVPEAEQCGWLKDIFGVSWQIVPKQMDAMMATKDSAALKRVTEAFLQMKKFDVAQLEKAYKGS